MSGNTLGKLFCVTSFGESHGPAYGGVVDGCPPGLELCEADIQQELDRRKPGTSRHVTQRREQDRVEILSGVFEGRPTGTAIGLLVRNEDQARTTAISPRPSAPAMPITPIGKSTAYAAIAAAGVLPRARPWYALPPARSRRSG